METTETIEPSSPTTNAKPSKQQKILVIVAIISTLLDFVLIPIVGDNKATPLGVSSDVVHLISMSSIVAAFFVCGNWFNLSKPQKPLALVVIVGVFITGILDLVDHAAGMDSLAFPILIASNISSIALVVVLIIGFRNKRQNKLRGSAKNL